MNSHSKKEEKSPLWKSFYERALRGDPCAQCDLGYMFRFGYGGLEQDNELAVVWFSKAAILGHAEAQYSLGEMYRYGRGLVKNYGQAIKWFNKAIAQGDFVAVNFLGEMYENGEGVDQDDAKALELITSAAQKNVFQAICNLGWRYVNGRGVPRDEQQALEWFKKLPPETFHESQWLKQKMTCGIPKEEKEAIQWHREGASLGCFESQVALAQYYETGQGVPINPFIAFNYYQDAAKKGFAPAQFGLGRIYEEGRGKPVDQEIAVYWYVRAARQKHPPAQHNLGRIYEFKNDHVKALHWHHKAAEQEYAPSQYNLGLLYAKGVEGIPYDKDTANEWFFRAAQQGYKAAEYKIDKIAQEDGPSLSAYVDILTVQIKKFTILSDACSQLVIEYTTVNGFIVTTTSAYPLKRLFNAFHSSLKTNLSGIADHAETLLQEIAEIVPLHKTSSSYELAIDNLFDLFMSTKTLLTNKEKAQTTDKTILQALENAFKSLSTIYQEHILSIREKRRRQDFEKYTALLSERLQFILNHHTGLSLSEKKWIIQIKSEILAIMTKEPCQSHMQQLNIYVNNEINQLESNRHSFCISFFPPASNTQSIIATCKAALLSFPKYKRYVSSTCELVKDQVGAWYSPL